LLDVTPGEFVINWAPATEEEEVAQNVAFLISAPSGSVPLARSIGATDAVDGPITHARAMLMTNLVRTIGQFEPRATVREINFDASDMLDGQLVPTVRIEI
jgi:phage baseplate assembly protein W